MLSILAQIMNVLAYSIIEGRKCQRDHNIISQCLTQHMMWLWHVWYFNVYCDFSKHCANTGRITSLLCLSHIVRETLHLAACGALKRQLNSLLNKATVIENSRNEECIIGIFESIRVAARNILILECIDFSLLCAYQILLFKHTKDDRLSSAAINLKRHHRNSPLLHLILVHPSSPPLPAAVQWRWMIECFGDPVGPKVPNKWTACYNEIQHKGPGGVIFLPFFAQILPANICLCPPLSLACDGE